MPVVKNNSVKEKIAHAIRDCKNCRCAHHSSGGCGVYGLGVIGAGYYFFLHLPVKEEFIFTIFKIIFWPAFLVYHLLETQVI